MDRGAWWTMVCRVAKSQTRLKRLSSSSSSKVEGKGFPNSSVGKESACNTGNPSLIPGLRRSPGEGKGYPLQYSGLEKSMDSPWGCKELDMTERLSLSLLVKCLEQCRCSIPTYPFLCFLTYNFFFS